MDQARKRYLKKIAKENIQKNSARIKALVNEANPVSLDDPQWVVNFKYLRHKEQEYHDNRTQVYPKKMLGKEILLNPVALDISNGFLPVPGYYMHCLVCHALVPMNPAIPVKCQCEQIAIDLESNFISLDLKKIEVVKLIAKAKQSLYDSLIYKLKKFFRR